MSRFSGSLRPIHATVLVILMVAGAVEWRRQSVRAELAAERENLLETRRDVLDLEREMLLARTEESEALATGRSSVRERLKERHRSIEEQLRDARERLDQLGIDDAGGPSAAFARYRQSMEAELELAARIGYGHHGTGGLLGDLRRLEQRLTELVPDRDMRFELLALQVQEREYAATLNTSQATGLLERVDRLRAALREEKARGSETADALDDYRRQVENAMAAALEMELLRGEASVRFERLPILFRDLEARLDQRLEQSTAGIARLRRAAVWQVALLLAVALVLFALRVRSERRETRRTLGGVRRLVSGMEALGAGARGDDLDLPDHGDLGKISDSFRTMAEQIRSQIATIERERRRSEEAAQAKADFLARVSHELRTPLHGILGMGELLDASRLDAEQQHLLDILRQSGVHLLHMVNDLLDLEKLQAGKLALESQPFEVLPLLEDMVATHAAGAHGKGLELVLRVPAEVPKTVEGDPLRLNQVLTNLIGNALKFTESGHVELAVAAHEVDDPERVGLELTVSDTGPGVPEVQRAKIFEPFAQGERFLQRKHGGSGLGLSIVRELVALMGGTVDVSSGDRPDPEAPGAVFRVRVELGRGGVERDPEPPALDGRPLVVIDDHAPSRDATAEALRALGAVVEVVADLEALSIRLQEDPPDAVVVGHGPGEDGSDPSPVVRILERVQVPSIHVLPTNARGASLRAELDGRAGPGPVPMIALRRPARRSALAEAVPRLSSAPASAQAKPFEEEATPSLAAHLLLVEDNPINQEVVLLMLRDCGCEIEVAENGEEALEWIEREPFDLVFMDCQMPVMDGYEATRAIRRLDDPERAEVPIIALTAGALDEEQRRCFESGMNAVISKPASRETLMDHLVRFLPPIDESESSTKSRHPATPSEA